MRTHQLTFEQRQRATDAARAALDQAEQIVARTEAEGNRPMTRAEHSAFEGAVAEYQRQQAKLAGRDPDVTRHAGSLLARLAHAVHLGKGQAHRAAEYATEQMDDRALAAVLRAAQPGATTTAQSWAGELVREDMLAIVEGLAARGVFARVVRDPLDLAGAGGVRIPRRTGKVSGAFVEEHAPIPVKAGAFDGVSIAAKKLGVIVLASEELLTRASPIAQRVLGDAMLDDSAEVLDEAFLGATPAGVAPAGLLHPSNAADAIASTGDPAKDLAALVAAMAGARVPMTRPAWLINPLAIGALAAFRVGDAFPFRAEVNAGRLQGIAIESAVGIAPDVIALADCDQVVGVIEGPPDVQLARQAAIEADDAASGGGRLVSLFQMQAAALRLTWPVSWSTKRREAVQVLTGAAWGRAS